MLAAVDDALEHGAISEASWAGIREHVPAPADQLELVTAIGTWGLISKLARSIQIPLEEGVASWPPDGQEGGE